MTELKGISTALIQIPPSESQIEHSGENALVHISSHKTLIKYFQCNSIHNYAQFTFTIGFAFISDLAEENEIWHISSL